MNLKITLDIQKVVINDFLEINDLLNIRLVSKNFKSLVNEDNFNEKKKIVKILGEELIKIVALSRHIGNCKLNKRELKKLLILIRLFLFAR